MTDQIPALWKATVTLWLRSQMGHGTIQMSMRYAHLSPDHKAAVDRLVEYKIKGTPKADTEQDELQINK